MRLKHNKVAATVAVLCGLLGAGCRTIHIESNPPGAKIVINGFDTGKTTPFVYKLKHFPTGDYKFAVEKEGYSTVTPPQDRRIRVSSMEILLSFIWPPSLLKNLFHTRWKQVWPRGPLTFQLQEGAGQSVPIRDENAAPSETGRDSIPARLDLLTKLKDQGRISEDEYKQKRKALLDEL
jgi:hypothetical protein